MALLTLEARIGVNRDLAVLAGVLLLMVVEWEEGVLVVVVEVVVEVGAVVLGEMALSLADLSVGEVSFACVCGFCVEKRLFA